MFDEATCGADSMDLKQWYAFVRDLETGIPEDEIIRLFLQCDVDGSGQVERDEFLHIFQRM